MLILIMPASAQGAATQIFITSSDASSAPTIELHAYAVDDLGNPVTLDASSLVVKHNGAPVNDVTIGSPYAGGTFLIFLLDAAEGTDTYLLAIQDAIRQYAGDPYMKDSVDYVSIFTVSETGANQILAPTEFRNTVQNAFATPLAATTGATALYDSLMGLLTGTIPPKPDLITHLVVMSDGTDVVSTRNTGEQVSQTAASLHVPVHTVLLENEEVKPENRQKGRDFMTQLATVSRGRAFSLSTAADLTPLWDHIARFSDQSRVLYTISDLAGGSFTTELSLAANPGVLAQDTVTIPAGAPSIVINVSEDNRQLTLIGEGQPITLRFSTTVSWLDGVDRQVAKAQLIVNNLPVKEIDVNELDDFEAEITNLKFGDNPVQIEIEDDQGNRATSQEIIFTASQGTTIEIPEDVEPAGTTSRIWDRIKPVFNVIGGCLLVALLFLVFAGIVYASRKSRLVQRLGLTSLMRRLPFIGPYFSEVYKVQQGVYQAKSLQRDAGRYSKDVKGTSKKVKGGRPNAFLEVLDSVTQVSDRINLDQVEVRLGRSSKQADIAFKSDGTVSRIHSSIVLEGGLYRIFDEQSTSGTFVNEQAVPNYGLQLTDGDEIRLGAVRLRFRQLG
jgi:hypothetical protein